MKNSICAALTVCVLAAPSTAMSADSVAYAYALCNVIDNTGLTSAPCKVSGGSSAVIATIDMNSTEARGLCAKIADAVRQQGKSFDAGWTLQIRSPYSGEQSIAFCKL